MSETFVSVLGTRPSFLLLKSGKGNEPFDKDSAPDNEESESDQKFDVDTARLRLESLISGEKNASRDKTNRSKATPPNRFSVTEFLSRCRDSLPPKKGDDDGQFKESWFEDDTDRAFFESLLPPRPPMSATERKRRQVEIQLLRLLEDSDDVTGQIWDLWFSERGPEYANILAQTDSLMAKPNDWKLCEQQLLELIDDPLGSADNDRPGVYFVEAINRMATLYFLQGRLQESYILCRLVLYLKPWHFGALSGIVQVAIGMGDRDEARFWAERRLPTLMSGTSFPPFPDKMVSKDTPKNPRRKEWCETAASQAQILLEKAEINTVKCLGQPEDYYSVNKSHQTVRLAEPDVEEEAWQ
jgi:hypothetical protein